MGAEKVDEDHDVIKSLELDLQALEAKAKKEEKPIGKPPLQKSKIQASRFNKTTGSGGIGLKKSP